MMGIKIKSKELREKSKQELLKMKKDLKNHLVMAKSPQKQKTKGFNIKEEKKNIARINTILREK